MNAIQSVIAPLMVATEYATDRRVCERTGFLNVTFMHGREEVAYRVMGNGFIPYNDPRPVTIIGVLEKLFCGEGKNALKVAVDSLLARFDDVLPPLIRQNKEAHAQHLMKAEKNFQRLMELLMCRRATAQTPRGTDALMYKDWLQAPAGVANVLTGEEWEEVRSLMKLASPAGVTSALVVPMFADTCSPAALYCVLHTPKSKEKYTTGIYWVDTPEGSPDYTHAFMAFHTFTPKAVLFAHTNPKDAIAAMLESRDDMEAHTFVTTRKQGGCGSATLGWLPRVCYTPVCNAISLLDSPLYMSQQGVIVHITNARHREDVAISGSISWEGAIADAIVDSIIEENEITSYAMMFLNAIRNNREAQRKVVRSLETANLPLLAEQVARKFKSGLIWSNNDQSLYATPSGYVHEDSHTAELGGSQVTNFTIEPVSVSVYEAGDKFYHCVLHMRDEERQMGIPAHVFDSMRKLEEYIQTSLDLSGNSTQVPPTIFEMNLARPILGWLIEKFAAAPRLTGRSYLGWSADKTSYINLSSPGIVLKPSVKHLQLFQTPSHSYPSYHDLEFMDVVYACAGIIARAYTNSAMAPVTFLNTPWTRQCLKAIFRAAGQSEIIHLNPNMRNSSELECFRGYPVLTTGYNCNQAKASKVGIILLGEEGRELKPVEDTDNAGADITHTTTAALISDAGATITYITAAIPEWIIKNDGLTCVFSSENVTSDQIIEDGKTILSAMYTIK